MANLIIIALTAVSDTTAGFLTDAGIFLMNIEAGREPNLEFYFKLEKSYTDITCKNSNGHIEFFVLNPEAAKIERICRGSFNKLEKQELPSEQVQHLLKNAVALKYDAKNNLLLVLSSELEQFTMLSCGLEVIHRCHTVSELRSFTIDSEGSIICLRQPK